MVSLSLAKQHLEYDASDRDDLINQYIAAAAAWVENYTGKRLTVGAVTDQFAEFGKYITPTRGPLVSVTTIAYVDTEDAAATVTGAKVVSGRIYPPEAGWPEIAENSAINVTYQAGYASAPADLVNAQLLLIGHWFANREAVNVGNIVNELPFAVEALCRPYRALTV